MMNKKAYMDFTDWLSGFIGLVVFALGLIPILESLKVLDWGVTKIFQQSWVLSALPFVLAILGLYLAIESVVELTQSNHIGWLSFLIGTIVMIVGLLPALEKFGIGPGLFGLTLPPLVYYIIFIIEGFFLMIAMFAMEL